MTGPGTKRQGGEAQSPRTPSPRDRAPAVRLGVANVSKSFGAVEALKDVSLELRRGEVHALVGENGAGKSTLAKIIGGAERPDAGRLELDGREISPSSPAEALAAGISVVYQDLNLAPELTVAASIFLAREPRGRLGFIDDRAMYAAAARLLEPLGAGFPPHALVGDLNTGDRQLAEIARALSFEPSLLVMDEPTASLSHESSARLFELIKKVRDAGTTIVYITHELAHVFELADRVSVLKDGELMKTIETAKTSRDEMIETMVGRSVGDLFPSRAAAPQRSGTPALATRELTLPGYFDSISFELHPGEILGFAGLVGSGRTRLAQAIFGVLPEQRYGPLRGELLLGGEPVRISSPRAAVKRGIGYVPEDRKLAGLILDLSIAANISLPQLEIVARAGLIDRSREQRMAADQVEALRIRTPSTSTAAANLSGGNQQKVVLGKWLARGCSVLILDEPTTGVDIGAKAEIYALINRIAEAGTAVMLISSDLPELLGLSDRIVVMSRGRIVSEETRDTATEESLVRAAFSGNLDEVEVEAAS